ncbi:MAG: roadblock/LC7 domain-containing protein [Dermatophilus congolensis]|nr:roadblock/LC7 domain-containing protein [Dermatophilus congolensis]
MSTDSGAHRAPAGVQVHDNPEPVWDDETDFDILAKIESTGEATLPVLQELAAQVPGIDGAMVCTADGYNLCALGLEEAQVGRLAAMTSSLYSVSRAACGAVAAQSRSGHEEALDQVTLRSGDTQYMVFPIEHDQLGYLLLSVWAKDVSLGELLMEAKISAREIERIVHAELKH